MANEDAANDDPTDTVRIVSRLAMSAANTAITRAQLHAEDQEYYEQMQYVHDTVQEHFMGLIPWLKKILRFMVLTTLLLISSIITYGVFYIIVMPGNHSVAHLYFDYTCSQERTASNMDGVCEATENGEIDCRVATTSQECLPKATVDLFARQSPWQALNPDVVPNPITKHHVLKPRQHYLMDIALVLPESSTNIHSGMFGISVALTSSNGTALAYSTRSTRLPHESTWIGVLRRAICIVPLLLGALTESRTIIVEPFRHYVESAEYPLRYVTVQLLARGNNNAWQDSSPVEVVSGSVRIGKELNWLQGILREYFYSCYIMGTLCIFVFQAVFWSFFGQWLELQREERRRLMEEWEQQQQEEQHVAWDEVAGEEDDEWDDLPTHGQQQEPSGRPPVTPEHQEAGNDGNEGEPDQGEDPTTRRTEEVPSEEVRAERVVRGETEPFEVFTDHDDPDF